MDYKEQLTNPKWQKKRLEIFERDKFTCQICLDTEETLQVHHKSYDKGKKAWEYGNDRLITLCKTCHERLTVHLKEGNSESTFSVLKIRNNGILLIVTHSGDETIIERGKDFILLDSFSSNKLVQFLINNWLKNG